MYFSTWVCDLVKLVIYNIQLCNCTVLFNGEVARHTQMAQVFECNTGIYEPR